MQMKQRGFTLIELMIVLAVFAIVASIGYPLYSDQVRKARRADAKASLSDVAQVLERCRTNNNTYLGCTVVTTSTGGYYAIALSNLAVNTYTITATAKGAQLGDTTCATFSITHTGSTSATSATCW